MAMRGRPPKRDRKDIDIHMRMNQEEYEMLIYLMTELDKSKSDVMNYALRELYYSHKYGMDMY